MKLTIDRERWGRGDPRGGKLHRECDGTMCCLGFFLLACGVEQERLTELGEPSDLANGGFTKEDWPVAAAFLLRHVADRDPEYDIDFSYWEQEPITTELMCVNDDTCIEEEQRERTIAELFAKHGIEVAFVDSVPPIGGAK